MIKLRKTDPKYLTVVKQIPTGHGKFQILRDARTRQYFWRTISKNGAITAGGRGLNSVKACLKGASATQYVLNTLVGLGEI